MCDRPAPEAFPADKEVVSGAVPCLVLPVRSSLSRTEMTGPRDPGAAMEDDLRRALSAGGGRPRGICSVGPRKVADAEVSVSGVRGGRAGSGGMTNQMGLEDSVGRS